MTEETTPTLAAIYRYPIKGLSPQPVEQIVLTAGEGVPQDRRFAIAHGASQIDPTQPAWQSKRHFFTLFDHERLAALDTWFDDESGVLTVKRAGKTVLRSTITAPLGREVVNQFLAAYMRREAPGVPKLVEAPGVMFSDSPDKLVSLIGLASIHDLERVTRRPVDPRRFRANLLIDGARPWAEFEWIGRTVTIGGARLRVIERIERCAATNVNPDTAERDLNIPKALKMGFGHVDCGVLATVVTGGPIAVGDRVVVAETAGGAMTAPA